MCGIPLLPELPKGHQKLDGTHVRGKLKVQSSRCCAGEEHDVSFLCRAPHLHIEGTCEIENGDGEGLSGPKSIGWQWCFNFLTSGAFRNFSGEEAV